MPVIKRIPIETIKTIRFNRKACGFAGMGPELSDRIEKRFATCAERNRTLATRPVLIIEGGDIYAQRDIHPNAIKGVLAAIAIDMGVSLLCTKDEQDTAQMLFVLAKREESERGERKVHPHKAHRSMKEEQEYIVSAFPEIGLRNARLLLAHFGTVQAIVNASLEELAAVKGIGEKTAERVFELSRKKYE